MNGVIVMWLEDLIKERFGRQGWKEVVNNAGFNEDSVFLAGQDIPEPGVFKLISAGCKLLNQTVEQSAEAFGIFWINEFAPRMHKSNRRYRSIGNAKDFMCRLNDVHKEVTRLITCARPPFFEFINEDEKVFLILHKSDRGLMDIMIGLIKGVARYFKEEVSVLKVDEKVARIVLGSTIFSEA